MCVGGGKLYSAGSDQAIISWNLENLTLHKKVEVGYIIVSGILRQGLFLTDATLIYLKFPSFFQNAHDNIICAIVYNGKYLFTSSHSCIKVS